jgi:hypothetical protein
LPQLPWKQKKGGFEIILDSFHQTSFTAKLCEVGSEFNIFCTLVTMENGHHFEFVQTPQQLPHTAVDIPTKFHEV